jgi:ribosomal protein S18 acetylase RimI-like enzyme
MTKITTRTAQLEDLPLLYAYEQGIVGVERPFDPTLKPGHINYYDIKEMIVSADTEVVVAVSGAQIIGSGYVKIKKGSDYVQYDTYGYIGFMYVEEAYRRMGVSHIILEALQRWAKSRGVTELRLGVYDDNLGAIAAYEKFGFKKHTIVMRLGD